MLCQDCPDRNSCLKLCSRAEIYVSQDYVGLRELPIGLPMYGEMPEPISNIPLTKMEKKILTLLGQGLTRADVCEVMNITRGCLRWHLDRLRKKTNGKD
jgi:DNA-binding CsgD family transcriptional regulator